MCGSARDVSPMLTVVHVCVALEVTYDGVYRPDTFKRIQLFWVRVQCHQHTQRAALQHTINFPLISRNMKNNVKIFFH